MSCDSAGGVAASFSSLLLLRAANTDQGSSEATAATRPTVPTLDGKAMSAAAANPHDAVALPLSIGGVE